MSKRIAAYLAAAACVAVLWGALALPAQAAGQGTARGNGAYMTVLRTRPLPPPPSLHPGRPPQPQPPPLSPPPAPRPDRPQPAPKPPSLSPRQPIPPPQPPEIPKPRPIRPIPPPVPPPPPPPRR